MDIRDMLYEAANTFFDDEPEPVDIDDIENDIDVPAYLRKKAAEEEAGEEEIDLDDLEVPAYKRLPKRTDHESPLQWPEDQDPHARVPEDEEVPKFLRDKGAKVFPDDIEKPAFARKRSADVARQHGAILKRQ